MKQFADDEGWSRSTRRALAVTVLLGFVAMTLVLAWPLLSGRLYVNDDLGDLHIPIRYVYQTALRAGDSFLWAPQFMTGFDLHGEGQAAMYHPIHLLLYRTLSLQSALSTELLFTYVTMFPGMCFFLLRLGLPLPAALFGALTFTFSGFNLLHFMHLNIVFVVAHIPWLLAAIDVVLRTTSRRALALGQLAVSLATGSQLLAGHPQFVWYSLLAELAFVAWRLRNGGRWRRIPVLGWATILGVLLGAIQVLPTLHALAGSDRGSPSRDFPLVFSLERANLIQLWSPYALNGRVKGGNPHEFGLYGGSVCTVAVVWLFMRWHRLGRFRSLFTGSAIFATTMLVFALGSHGGLYRLVARVPPASFFRVPSRHILLVHLALAVMAALALADGLRLNRRDDRMSLRSLWPLGVTAALSVVTFGVHLWMLKGPVRYAWSTHLAPVGLAAIGTGMFLATCVIFSALARGHRWAPAGLIILTVIDLSGWGFSYIWSIPPQTLQAFADGYPKPPMASARDRLYIVEPSEYDVNMFAMNGYRVSEGHFSLKPRKRLPSSDLITQRLLGVRWILKEGVWTEVSRPLPRARMVRTVVVSDNVASDIRQIDVERTAVLDRPVASLGQVVEEKSDTEAASASTANILSDRPGLIEIVTSTPERRLLVLSESFDSGWKATQDGRPIEIYRAYGDLQACVVDAGVRRIVFEFRPASIRWGMAVSGVALVVVGLSIVLFRPWRPEGS